MAGVVVPTMHQKPSDLENIGKALQIASTVYGIKTSMDQSDRAKAEETRRQEEHQVKMAKSNLISEKESKLVEVSTVDAKGNPITKFVSPKEGETFLKPKDVKQSTSLMGASGGQSGPDYKAKISGLNATEKQRFDHVKSYAKAVDEMEAALIKGGDRYSLIGDNDFTAALDRAAESYGRMQSGGAINKDEEARFKNMIRAYGDDVGRTLTKLKTARSEADSRFETLGFSSNEVPEIAQARKQLEKLVANKGKPQGGWGVSETANAAPSKAGAPGPGSVVEYNGKKYTVGNDGDTLIPLKSGSSGSW